MEGLNDTAETLLASIERGEAEVSPSTLYAAACILEGVPYVNGAPQNTFVPGLIELAIKHNVLIGARRPGAQCLAFSRAMWLYQMLVL